MPYLPPEIVDPDTPITCALVFFPDAEEYRRALLGQIAELSDVWNWEDTRVNQAIIRQLWLEAESQTLECDNMACLDDLITYIDNVEPLLESIRDKPCCPQVTSAPPGTEDIGGVDDSTAPPGDQNIEGEIIPPEFEDVDEYQQYLCGAANRIADATDGAVDAIYDTILLASNVVVFATLVVLAFGNVIGMGIAAVLAGGYTLVTFSEVFGFFSLFTELREALDGEDPGGIVPATKAELAAAHDDIVNAIACANTPQEAAAALANVIDANVSDSRYRAMYKIMFNSLVMRAIWAGYMLDVTPSTNCNCLYDIDITETFDSDLGAFTLTFSGRAEWNEACLSAQVQRPTSPDGGITASAAGFNAEWSAGFQDNHLYSYQHLSYDVSALNNTHNTAILVQINVGGTITTVDSFATENYSPGCPSTHRVVTLSDQQVSVIGLTTTLLQVVTAGGGSQGQLLIDNIRLAMNDEGVI